VIDVGSCLIFDPQGKDEAVDALCAVRHKDAINTLRNVLQTQFTKDQRARALKAIVRISPESGLPIFKTAMGWLPTGFLEELAAELKGQFVEYVTGALGSTNDEIRMEAVKAFRHMGKDTATQILEREVFNVRESALRILMLERLAEIGSPNANKMIEAFLKDDSPEVRLAAVRLVSKYASKEQALLDELRKMLMDPDESDRVASAAALLNRHLIVN